MKKAILLIITIFLLVSLLACGTSNTSTSSTSNYDTHLIEIVQKQVSYTIVIPTYFPEGIQPYPAAVSGPAHEQELDSFEIIQINYQDKDNAIQIIEKYYTNTPLPSESTLTYLDIQGIKVSEETSQLLGRNPLHLLQGLQYEWHKDGLNIQVGVFGFSQDECRKVVESMIK